MNSKNLSNKKIKVTFLTLFVALFFLISSTNIKAANNGSVNISVSPNQITSEGATSATANISVSSDYPIANYLLTVTVNGQVVSTPTGLGLNEAKSHTINPIKIDLSGPGNYDISVSGEISINNGTDYESINVASSAKVTVSAPTSKATPTPAPKATPTPKPSPTPKKPGNNTTATTKAKPSSKAENNNNYKRINKKMVVTTDLDIRSNASLSSAYLGFYDKGTVVDVIGVTDDGWYVVNYNGKTAYLAGSYLNDYHASTPNSTKANNNNSNSEKTTSSKKNDESNASTTKKDDKTKKTTKTEKTNTSKTSTSGTTTEKSDSGLIIGTSDSNTNTKIANNKIKSLFAKLDPTMIIVFALIILLIILMIIYYILKKKILEDEEQDEFEELPSDNDEAIYANKLSKIEVSRVDDSENPKNNTEN